jgi:hypothetical protein
MKRLLLILPILLFFCFSIKAEERLHERVYIHTDKDCYVAGEDIQLKFYVVGSDFQPSLLSKVGYVEICDTKKPQIQSKIGLEKGHGAGKIKIPMDLPSGIYQLSGYTRYMRNEGEKVFFKKQIAIVNAGQRTLDLKRFEPVENYEQLRPVEKEQSNEKGVAVKIKTDQNRYGNRNKVLLSLDNIPDNTADLVVSVSRNDSIVFLPEINESNWKKQVTDVFEFSGQWIPEYEGHIITGRFIPEPKEELLANLSFTGNDIRYINGQVKNGTISFYTAGIFGKQQIVTSAIPISYDKLPYRVDLLTPFDESLPGDLPVLKIYPNEKALLERYIGVQIQGKMNNDSLNNPTPPGYSSFQPALSYDLDEYTKFSTISETILEFVKKIYVTKVQGKRTIGSYSRFGLRTLVLLDGIPIYDHEDILRYNPMHIKMIHIYDGCYAFGNENFEYIVSFITREGNLPFFQLGRESQLLNYDCPQLPIPIEIPDYSTARIKNSGKPDFRHTLYWNPLVKFTNGKPVNLSFYTSDLCGEFKVTVEGITTDGEMIRGISSFQVTAAPK